MKYLLSLILTLLQMYGMAQVIDPCDMHTIHTYASADTLIAPDEIFIEIITAERDSKSELQKVESDIISKLQSIGIDASQALEINHFGAHLQHKLFSKNAKEYRVYELKVTSVEQAISAMNVLKQMDLSSVQLIRTAYSKVDDVRLELRQQAIVKAKKQAVALTLPLGQSVGKAVMIMDVDHSEINQASEGFELLRMEQESLFESKAKTTSLDLKKSKYVVVIHVQFELN